MGDSVLDGGKNLVLQGPFLLQRALCLNLLVGPFAHHIWKPVNMTHQAIFSLRPENVALTFSSSICNLLLFWKHSAHVGQSIVAMTHLIQPDISAAAVWDRHRKLKRKEMTVAHVRALCAAASPLIPPLFLLPPMTERWPLPPEFELAACGRNVGSEI